MWTKSIDLIYPKATKMINKPRHNQIYIYKYIKYMINCIYINIIRFFFIIGHKII